MTNDINDISGFLCTFAARTRVNDMPSKERLYIDKMRGQFRSPILLWEEMETHFGAEAKVRMSYDDAHRLYNEALNWACWNDMAVQDYLAERCHVLITDEDSQHEYIDAVKKAMGAMAEHLGRGRELGLNELEQRVVDTLWGWVPHDYWDNYVDCAREVSKAIVRLNPPETALRSEAGYGIYLDAVIKEVKQLAEKYDVEFDTTKYNLSAGYLCEWLAEEYGFMPDYTEEEEF